MEWRGGDTSGGAIAAEVMGGYGPLLEPPEVMSRAAKVAKTLRFRTPAKLYIYETLLEWLAYNLKHMAFEFGPLVSAQKPVMGQGCRFRGRAADCKRRVLEILRWPFEEGVI